MLRFEKLPRARRGGRKKEEEEKPRGLLEQIKSSISTSSDSDEGVGGWMEGWRGRGVVVVVNVFNADSGEDSIPGKMAIKLRLFQGVN